MLCRFIGHKLVDTTVSEFSNGTKIITVPLDEGLCGEPKHRACSRCYKIHHEHNWMFVRKEEIPIGEFSVEVKIWRKCSICKLEAYTGYGDYTRFPQEDMSILSEAFTNLGGVKTFGVDSGLYSNIFEGIISGMREVTSKEEKLNIAKSCLLSYLGVK